MRKEKSAKAQRIPRRVRWFLIGGLWAAAVAIVAWRVSHQEPTAGDRTGPTAPEVRPGPRDVAVHVVDAQQQPVTGAEVAAWPLPSGASPAQSAARPPRPSAIPPMAKATTDAQGRARLRGLQGDVIRIRVERAGYARSTRPLPLKQQDRELRVVLLPAAWVHGLVVDPEGAPVPKAWAQARLALDDSAAPWTTETRTDGSFHFDTLPPESVRLEVGAEGYAPVIQRVRPGGDALRITLQLSASIAGTVSTPEGAAEGATVVLAGSGVWPPRRSSSDAKGEFRFAGIPPGVYEVRAHRGDWVAQPREGISLEAGATVELAFQLRPGGRLEGQVLAAHDRTPLRDAEVVITDGSLSLVPLATRTDEAGHFTWSGLTSRVHRVTAHAPGFISASVERDVDSGPVTLHLEREATIRGRVVDDHGRPVEGARVEALAPRARELPEGPARAAHALTGRERHFRSALFQAQLSGPRGTTASGELGVTFGGVPAVPVGASPQLASRAAGLDAVSDGNGRYYLRGIPPGTVELLARHPEYAVSAAESLRVGPGGQRQDVTLVLRRGGTVDGRVVDAQGYPVGDVRIELHAEREPFSRYAVTESDGVFRFEGVLGAVAVTAHPGLDAAPVRATLTAKARSRHQVELRLTGDTHGLRGRVQDPRGFPIAAVTVTLRSLRADSPLTRTVRSETDGTFALGHLPPPPWELAASHNDYARAQFVVEEAPGRSVSVELQPGTFVRGQVVHRDTGAGVAHAWVELAGPGPTLRTRSSMDGWFEFHRLLDGNYSVNVSHRNFVSASQRVSVTRARAESGRVETDAIPLAPGGAIAGEVVDAYGEWVPRARVQAVDATRATRVTRTDGSGHFRLEGLAAGAASVEAQHPEAGSGREPRVYVEAGATATEVRVRLRGRLPSAGEPQDPSGSTPGRRSVTGVAVTLALDGGTVVVASVWGERVEAAGLRVGDILRAVDGKSVPTVARGEELLRGSASVAALLEVERAGELLRLWIPRQPWLPPE